MPIAWWAKKAVLAQTRRSLEAYRASSRVFVRLFALEGSVTARCSGRSRAERRELAFTEAS